MEAWAPGLARRGRRRASGSPLSRAAVVLLLSAFLLRAPPTVKVYVMVHQKSPHVLCVTQRLRNSELIDPAFQWHGPKGKIVSENSTTHITTTGSLVFQDFEEGMTGAYTCFLEYKPTVEEAVKNVQLKFIVYVHSRYHSAPCNSIYNISFENKLLQILSKLVHDIKCEVSLQKSECHHVKMQKAGFQNELFFKFADTEKESKPCDDHTCDYSKRLSKAKNLIERFFSQQVEVLGRRASPLPEIYYIEDTLQMVWINRCFPGYGINAVKHPKCPECCVICSPGSYNPSDGTHCLHCNSSLLFGAKSCL
ncbi:hypothetical protein QTO34_004305 [Cnephaeus nilssonii]|uniref:Zona pellucida-binding protein 1 n=1 Tax=Cnephaeus nilssonii TaxID=3371016 RepID=A0AA40LK90_CNENI|nr:hypothetical protein QTO34_004305 [Eptesicus nilssonii]